MDDLNKLKNLTQTLTVLYVEDSQVILKQLGSFLEKIFKKVYIAKDGLEGLEKYKLNIPDLVLTNLTMPRMDGFEMTKSLKKINPKVKVIIISAHTDVDNLLDAIHMGVCDFIPKPIDRVLLGNALFKVANELIDNTKIISKDDLDKEDNIIKKLSIISEQRTPIEFINHYKGVPIIHDGYIIDLYGSNIIVHAPYIQTKSILYEKFTVIETPLIDNSIELTLTDIDSNTREITLGAPQVLQFSPRTRKQVRVEVDDSFKTVLHYLGKKIDADIDDVSATSISLRIKKTDLLKEGDDVNLTMGFETNIKVLDSTVAHSQRVSIKANIFKFSQKENYNELVLLFNLPKNDDETLGRYILQREIEIIQEFKSLNIGTTKS
ncbi:MAG: response regulator [Campylobacterota bacterium]|nr:response regulator [Campylobacterota bacterium]